jgi:hypothetical protein
MSSFRSKATPVRYGGEKAQSRSIESALFLDNEYKNGKSDVGGLCSFEVFYVDELTDQNMIFDDDSKFARQIKKLMRDEEDDRKVQKLVDLSSYLDQPENIKFVLKLGKPALNILLKALCEQ